MADYFSRLESDEAGDGVRDEFHDAEPFRVIAELTTDATIAEEDKWLTDIHQFLSTGLPPREDGSGRTEAVGGSEPPVLSHR